MDSVTYYVTLPAAGNGDVERSGKTSPCLMGMEPDEQQQGALGVRQMPPAHEQLMDALPGQAEQATQPGFLPVFLQPNADALRQFVPERRIDARLERPAPAGALPIRHKPCRRLHGVDGRIEQGHGEFSGQDQLGRKVWNHVREEIRPDGKCHVIRDTVFLGPRLLMAFWSPPWMLDGARAPSSILHLRIVLGLMSWRAASVIRSSADVGSLNAPPPSFGRAREIFVPWAVWFWLIGMPCPTSLWG